MLAGKLFISNEALCDDLNTEFDTTKRLNHIKIILHHFWPRWRNDYVTSLCEYHKKYNRKNELVPHFNDIVIVFKDKQPYNKWLLGRVFELIIGQDDKIIGVRNLMGKTSNIISRTVSKVYPIELYEKKENQNESNIDEHSSRTQREAAITADI